MKVSILLCGILCGLLGSISFLAQACIPGQGQCPPGSYCKASGIAQWTCASSSSGDSFDKAAAAEIHNNK